MIWFHSTKPMYQTNISAVHNQVCDSPNSICSSKNVFRCHAFDNWTTFLNNTKREKKIKNNWLTWFSLNTYMLVVHKLLTNDYIVSHSLVLGFTWIGFMPWEDLHEIFKTAVNLAFQGTLIEEFRLPIDWLVHNSVPATSLDKLGANVGQQFLRSCNCCVGLPLLGTDLFESDVKFNLLSVTFAN